MNGLVECDAFLSGAKWVPRDQVQFRPSVCALIIHQDRLLVVDNLRTGKRSLPGRPDSLFPIPYSRED